MRSANDGMIRHPVEFGVCHRYPSVMRLWQKCRCDWVDRPVTGDDADQIVDWRKQRVGRFIPLRSELLSRRPEKRAVRPEMLEAVGDLAAAVRRAEHDDAAQARWPVSGNVDPGQ